jgi:hypothetical protein
MKISIWPGGNGENEHTRRHRGISVMKYVISNGNVAKAGENKMAQ